MSLDRRKMLALGAGAAALAATGPGVAVAAAPSDGELAQSLGFRSNYARVNGVRLHYVTGGRGEPLFLLPGWPQTWWQYHKVMPALARSFRVIVPDLRGMGGSEKPAGGYDRKTMARDIAELARHLGYQRVNVAGHDIGAQVAFSFAVNHAAATRKVALMDVGPADEDYYSLPVLTRPGQGLTLWWFAFNQLQGLPEQLLAGRSRHLIDWMFDNTAADPAALSPRDRAIFARAYDAPGAIRASNGWYQSFHQDIADLKTYPKITAPLLALATAFSYEGFQQKLPGQATDFRVVMVENSGHWIPEEQPEVTIRELAAFFA